MLYIIRNIILVITIITSVSCYHLTRIKVKEPENALVRVRYFWPEFRDDMDLPSLILSAKRSLLYLDKLPDEKMFSYGHDRYSAKYLRKSLRTFLQIIQKRQDSKEINKELREKFLLYKTTGCDGNGKTLFTGYFEPIIEGNIVSNSIYSHPIYRVPDNLYRINLGLFHIKYIGQYISARVEDKKILPYFTRKNIVMERALEGKGFEIAWLKDPLDVAILQIQGSGIIRLPDGSELNVGYGASNGHPYKSIGRYMIDKGYIDKANLSLESIRSYLIKHPHIKDKILNSNPSYTFFRLRDQGPVGSIGVALTPERSLALDSRLFPKGALAYITCKKPVIDENGNIVDWAPFSRFVFNQDTGGAIKGSGRADIFWGNGEFAELAASHLKHEGEIYFLVMKRDL